MRQSNTYSSNKAALRSITSDFDAYDPWGSCISTLFDLCDYTECKRSVEIPSALQYTPSPYVCRDLETLDPYTLEEFDRLSDDQLLYCLIALNKYAAFLKKAGKDY